MLAAEQQFPHHQQRPAFVEQLHCRIRTWAPPNGLVAATDIGPGDRVLDVAAGTGNAALAAAATGAEVVASDLCPELLEQGRRLGTERGVTLDWREANAEALPFETDAFDAVLSCIG